MSSIDPVSIIIPVSRDSKTLRRCLDSLLLLDRRPEEVLLIGDTGPLYSPEGLNTVFIRCIEKSPSIRRNVGARHARGSIYCFIDDDVQVPGNWLSDIVSILKENPSEIIGGPNHDRRKDFIYRYPSAIQANIMTEGLMSHKKMDRHSRPVGIHDLPLCNIAMKKEVHESIGGFNEDIPYLFDDVEFNYIASRLGFRLMQYDKLEVQHDIRPAWLPYFRYKFLTRWAIGRIMPLYGCLYTGSLQIRLVLASYIVLPLLFIIDHRLIAAGAVAYLMMLCASAWPFRKDFPVFLLTPAGVLITQCLMYTGFTAGLLTGYLNYPGLKKLVPQRERRFEKFKDKAK